MIYHLSPWKVLFLLLAKRGWKEKKNRFNDGVNETPTMSLPARLLAPLETAPARISSALYVCSTCRRQCLPQALRSVNQFQFRQYHPSNSSQSNDNGDLPVTEKLRRKIWGTDKPPGVKDPYGSESQLDHVEPPVELSQVDPLLESEIGEEDQGMRVATAEEKAHGEYKSADTWEGLRQVGAEQWWENPPRAEDYFEPYVLPFLSGFLFLFLVSLPVS